MTSHFDALGSLWYAAYRTNTHPEWQKLVSLIQDEAIRQIDKVNPKALNFKEYKQRDWVTSREIPEHEVKADFIDAAHGSLDHTDKYHLKIFEPGFATLVTTLGDMIDDRSGLGWVLRKESYIKLYREIWSEIVRLVDSGVIELDEYNKQHPN